MELGEASQAWTEHISKAGASSPEEGSGKQVTLPGSSLGTWSMVKLQGIRGFCADSHVLTVYLAVIT